MGAAEEKAIANLGMNSMTLGQQLDALIREMQLRNTMYGVLADNRMAPGPASMLPNAEPSSGLDPYSEGARAQRAMQQDIKRNWTDPRPLDVPHVRECDRLMDAQDARDKLKR